MSQRAHLDESVDVKTTMSGGKKALLARVVKSRPALCRYMCQCLLLGIDVAVRAGRALNLV